MFQNYAKFFLYPPLPFGSHNIFIELTTKALYGEWTTIQLQPIDISRAKDLNYKLFLKLTTK